MRKSLLLIIALFVCASIVYGQDTKPKPAPLTMDDFSKADRTEPEPQKPDKANKKDKFSMSEADQEKLKPGDVTSDPAGWPQLARFHDEIYKRGKTVYITHHKRDVGSELFYILGNGDGSIAECFLNRAGMEKLEDILSKATNGQITTFRLDSLQKNAGIQIDNNNEKRTVRIRVVQNGVFVEVIVNYDTITNARNGEWP